MHPTVAAIEAFNVKLCADSGAGQGPATTEAALAEYRRLLVERRDEACALASDYRAAKVKSSFADGFINVLAWYCSLATA